MIETNLTAVGGPDPTTPKGSDLQKKRNSNAAGIFGNLFTKKEQANNQ